MGTGSQPGRRQRREAWRGQGWGRHELGPPGLLPAGSGLERRCRLAARLMRTGLPVSFFHFMRRFWNQILIWRSDEQSAWAISMRRRRVGGSS